MKIPWKQGRRALVWDAYNEVWVEAVGRSDLRYVDGAKGWLCCPVNDEVLGFEVPADSTDVRLLPNQCPRCFEVDDHADGCMVAANLARGVPAFWAPWAMEAPPEHDRWDAGVYAFAGALYPMEMETYRTWWEPNSYETRWAVAGGSGVAVEECADWWVALGPDGPTLEPWGQS